MDPRVLAAVGNNADWCEAVCRSIGVPTRYGTRCWVSTRRSPPLYPDAVTLTPGTSIEEILHLVDGTPGCSVKDSFADLDLTAVGFEQLFEASWIHREPTPLAERGTADWAVVDDEQQLAAWVRAHGDAPPFRPDLLAHSAVRFLSARDGDEIVAGAVANRSATVIGVSNVFASTMALDEAWTGIAATLGGWLPTVPLVGYEHGAPLEGAVSSGFAAVGPLRVWLKPTPG